MCQPPALRRDKITTESNNWGDFGVLEDFKAKKYLQDFCLFTNTSKLYACVVKTRVNCMRLR